MMLIMFLSKEDEESSTHRLTTNWKCRFNDFNKFRQKYNFWPIPVFWRVPWSVIPFTTRWTVGSWMLTLWISVDIQRNRVSYQSSSQREAPRPTYGHLEALSHGISGNGVCYWGLLGWIWGVWGCCDWESGDMWCCDSAWHSQGVDRGQLWDPQPIDKSPMDQFSSQARLCLREFDVNLPKLKSLFHQVAESATRIKAPIFLLRQLSSQIYPQISPSSPWSLTSSQTSSASPSTLLCLTVGPQIHSINCRLTYLAHLSMSYFRCHCLIGLVVIILKF